TCHPRPLTLDVIAAFLPRNRFGQRVLRSSLPGETIFRRRPHTEQLTQHHGLPEMVRIVRSQVHQCIANRIARHLRKLDGGSTCTFGNSIARYRPARNCSRNNSQSAAVVGGHPSAGGDANATGTPEHRFKNQVCQNTRYATISTIEWPTPGIRPEGSLG